MMRHMKTEAQSSGNTGPNSKRSHFNAGTSRRSSGASFAQELRAWWSGQKLFGRQADLATTLGVGPQTLQLWMSAVAFPSDPLCDQLYSLTALPCFSPIGRAAARLEHEQKRGLSRASILKRSQRQYVTPEGLAECRTDPDRAFTIRGDRWIVCLECGQLLKQIRDKGYAAHLKEHGMSVGKYREGPDPARPRYGNNRSLICNAMAKRLADAVRANPRVVPDRGRKYLVSPAKGRKMPPEFSRKLATRMRGQRNTKWLKHVPDVEFVWPWVIGEKTIKEIARIVSGYSQDITFSSGGVWVRLKTIVGLPIRKNLASQPDPNSAEKAARILADSGVDDTKLKAEIGKLCEESRSEVAAQNRRGSTGVAILLIPKMRAWQLQNPGKFSPADLARRFLADRAWISVRQRRKKNATRPKARGSVGHPPGLRKRTQLRNEMAAITEIQERRQKEVADDFFPDKSDAQERMNSTFDYFSHHRPEIEKEKARLIRTPTELRALYANNKSELLKVLSKKRRKRLRRSN
jgi:hypothetical protein